MTEITSQHMNESRPHHRHLEQSRAQVIDLLSRQAVERELVSRSESNKQDVVAQLVARQQQAQLAQRLDSFHPADIAYVLESLAQEQRDVVLLEISDAVLPTLVADMRPDEIVAAVRHLESDEIADLVALLPEDVGPQVLAGLDRNDQVEVRSALSFPEGSVGAMMDMHFVSVREDASLEAVLRLLRRRKNDLQEENTDLVVVDRGNALHGMLSLQQLVRNEPEQTVGSSVLSTATTDTMGFFIFLGLAALFLI
jgi:magnesium transporter